MARPVRVECPGAWYHVTGRGVDRRPIFRDDKDRKRLLELIGEAVARFRWIVHGYTLMENHYHLIVQIQEINLSRGMQWTQTSYSMGFNHRHGRVGPLVQGRFKAVVADPTGWALELSRYVHLNPVRTARMGLDKAARKADRLGARGRPDARQVRQRVQRLRAYPWSSYRAYVGLDTPPEWLTRDVVLGLIGRGSLRQQQQAYTKYVEGAIREGLAESPWEQLEGQLILGTKRFVEEIRSRMGKLSREHKWRGALKPRCEWKQVIRAVEAVRGDKWSEFRDRHGDWGREMVLYLGRKQAGLTLRELGEAAGGIDYGAVTMAIKRFERRLAQDKSLRQIMTRVNELLNVKT